jgi:hypothetical protein
MLEGLANEYQTQMEEGRTLLIEKIHPETIAGQLSSLYRSLS